MLKLKNSSLVIIDCRNYAQAIHSLQKAMSKVEFDKVLFLTDIDIQNIDSRIEVKKIPSLRSKDEYSRFVIKQLGPYIETGHFLLIQWDAEILAPESWDDQFYEYDYVAAPWPFETDGLSVGCGGFSWRSKRLHDILASDDLIMGTPPEDVTICRIYRRYLEGKYNLKWPDEELADKFAYELKEPIVPSFGRHAFFHKPFHETIVIQRKASLGDIVALEPILSHFYNKGYRVVLDTLPQFFNLFIQHYFKVHHPDEIDPRLMKQARVISLDMAYELTPARLHLESYYEMAGIANGEIRIPKLTLAFDPKQPQAKMFKKYVVIHSDVRPQKSRNIYGVDWDKIADFLVWDGYDVIQIGQGEHVKIKHAVEMRNINEPMLMRLIGGADFMIAIDSGPANIAVAMNTPLIVFAGSVKMEYIYPDLSNVIVIEKEKVCRSPKCWHSVVSTEGIECVEIGNGIIKTTTQMYQGADCVEPDPIPPCVQFSTEEVIEAINKMINKHDKD